MRIRFANSQDIPGMISLLYQVGDVHHQIRPDIFRENALKYTPEQLEVLLQDETKPIFICDDGGFVAGYCFCQIRSYEGSTVLTDRKELYIDDLCVDENRRGQGIATKLYERTCEFAREIGCQAVTLNVWCGNDNAMHFYEKMGMKPQKIGMEAIL